MCSTAKTIDPSAPRSVSWSKSVPVGLGFAVDASRGVNFAGQVSPRTGPSLTDMEMPLAKFMPGADGKDAAASRGGVGNPRLTIARFAA
jgi:hypothetical protein